MTEPPSSPGASSGADPALELRRRLQGVNLYLIGMMGSGKSAVGRPLAEALGYRFLDADTSVEQVAGKPIPELFASEGEAGFRALEAAVLNQIAAWHSLVVATGGGVVTRPENWGHMRQGVVVWLDAPAPLLLQRLRALVQRFGPYERQVTGQHQPAIGIGRRPHRRRDRVPHARVANVLQVPGQATGPHGIQSVLKHSLVAQQGLQLVHPPTRRCKALTPARGQHKHGGR